MRKAALKPRGHGPASSCDRVRGVVWLGGAPPFFGGEKKNKKPCPAFAGEEGVEHRRSRPRPGHRGFPEWRWAIRAARQLGGHCRRCPTGPRLSTWLRRASSARSCTSLDWPAWASVRGLPNISRSTSVTAPAHRRRSPRLNQAAESVSVVAEANSSVARGSFSLTDWHHRPQLRQLLPGCGKAF